MVMRRALLRYSSAGLAALAFPGFAGAQTVDRTVRVVIGFPPGGPTDVVGRVIAERLRGRYANVVIVDNRPGAAGRLGVENVKTSPPDGTSMLFTPGSILTTYPHVYRKLSYDPLRDLAPVASVGEITFALTVGAGVPASVRTVADFVAWCKANPSKAAYASPAAGATPHFVGASFAQAAGVSLLHVPYKGSAPALTDLMGGQIPALFSTVYDVLEQAKAGTVRVLATSGRERSRFLPDVPTFAEAGYKDLVEREWFGFWVPARTPADIVEKLAAAIDAAVKEPAVQERLLTLGFEPPNLGPAALLDAFKADYERWGPIVKQSGFSPDE